MPRYPNETIMGEIGMFTQYWIYKESNLHWETNKIKKKTKQHKSKITRKNILDLPILRIPTVSESKNNVI